MEPGSAWNGGYVKNANWQMFETLQVMLKLRNAARS